MKKVFFLLLLAGIFGARPADAQLATKVSGANNYGAFFSDGTTLYALKADTIYSVNTGTGALTFLHKLPAPPAGVYSQWGQSMLAKTPLGFILDQTLISGSTTSQRLWTNTGSGWDTINTGGSIVVTSSLYKLGSKYSLLLHGPANQNTLMRTDFTRAGTTAVLASGIAPALPQFSGDFTQGTDRVYFSIVRGSTGTSNLAQEYYLDDNALNLIDSATSRIVNLAAIGNDVYYERQQSTTAASGNTVKKWSGGTNTVLIPSMPFGDYYLSGFVLNGRFVGVKIDSGSNNHNLVSIDLSTGAQTHLTANPPASFFPVYQGVPGIGTAHAYLLVSDSTANHEIVTDGISAAGTIKVPNMPLYFGRSLAVSDNLATMCGDDAYGRSAPSGTANYQLYRINGAGTVTSQVLSAGISTGSSPSSFTHVGSEIFFRAFNPSYAEDMWKITGCASTAVAASPAVAATAMLYPNPASSRFSVKLPGNIAVALLELYDATGRRVMSERCTAGRAYSVADFPAGIYIYRITATGVLAGVGRISITH